MSWVRRQSEASHAPKITVWRSELRSVFQMFLFFDFMVYLKHQLKHASDNPDPSVLFFSSQWTLKVITISTQSSSIGCLRSTRSFSYNWRSLPSIGSLRHPPIPKSFSAVSLTWWSVSVLSPFSVDLFKYLVHDACIFKLLILSPKLQRHSSILNAVVSLLLNILLQKVPREKAEGQLALLCSHMEEGHCIQDLRFRDVDINRAKIRRQTVSNEDTAKIEQ